MDMKDKGKKIKPLHRSSLVGLVMVCVAGSLSGYKEPVYVNIITVGFGGGRRKNTAKGS